MSDMPAETREFKALIDRLWEEIPSPWARTVEHSLRLLMHERDEARAALVAAHQTLKQSRNFITWREKMHPHGVELYDETIATVEAALPPPTRRRVMTTQTTDEKAKVMVCDKCLRAACWYGEFMCEDSVKAGLKVLTVADLRKLDREHEEYWSDEYLIKIYGTASREFHP